jgi:hypothetical protein
MALAPKFDAEDLVGSAEVVAVAGLAQPPPLAGGLAGQPTSGLGTIVLAGFVAWIGNEKLGATAAFASGLLAAHREPQLKEAQPGRKRKKKNRKKTESEEGRKSLE